MKYSSLDIVGMIASALCAIHCAALPLLLGVGILSGFHFLADPLIEHMVLYFSFAVAFLSLIHSYRKHHRHLFPMMLAGIGFLMIVGVHLLSGGHQSYHLILAIGGLCVAGAHFFNFRWSRSCDHSPTGTGLPDNNRSYT